MNFEKKVWALIALYIRRANLWLEERPVIQWRVRVFRLGLFQFGMGLSLAPITGTLNRVLITDLKIAAGFVALLMSIHYFVSPIRTVIGHHSDLKRSNGFWRTPYIVLGAMLTFGGLSTAPFSLILFDPESMTQGPIVYMRAFIIFLVYGVGVNIVETTYLALVSDITEDHERGKILAILWLMLVIGTVVGSLIVGFSLITYSTGALISVMQSSAFVFMVCMVLSLIQQEKLRPDGRLVKEIAQVPRQSLKVSLLTLWNSPSLRSMFFVFFIATLGFGTHDVLLEPYGAEILKMSVTATTLLTALWGVAMIIAVVIAGWLLWTKGHSGKLLISGALIGMAGFLTVASAGFIDSAFVFQAGVALIGFGRGLFIVGSIATVMSLADRAHTGLFMGIWGVVQSLAQGFGTIGGGVARDMIGAGTGNILWGYVSVYVAASVFLFIMVVFMLVKKINKRLTNGEIQSPWNGLQNIPADQLVF
jgi:BCD family chlorophyll transporter-like MFS transporter